MNDRSRRKVREGLVVSNRMDKTVVVAVETKKIHTLYKKAVKVTRRYKAHDESNDCKIGDKVKIVETRPLSREKRWRVIEVMPKRETAASSR
jgi:small subunit ribosomal protein S17